jgi:hypothetical protein
MHIRDNYKDTPDGEPSGWIWDQQVPKYNCTVQICNPPAVLDLDLWRRASRQHGGSVKAGRHQGHRRQKLTHRLLSNRKEGDKLEGQEGRSNIRKLSYAPKKKNSNRSR